MLLKIDKREPEGVKLAMESLALEKQFDVEREMLLVGDVACGDIIIERKEAGDFIASITDGRLVEQCAKMTLNYEHKYVIIEGNLYGVDSEINVRSIIGMMASMAVRHNIKFIIVNSVDNFAYACFTIINKHLDGKIFDPNVHKAQIYSPTKDDIIVNMIAQVPGISRERAETIKKDFEIETLGDVSRCLDDNIFKDLKKQGLLKGIGDGLIKKIKEVL